MVVGVTNQLSTCDDILEIEKGKRNMALSYRCYEECVECDLRSFNKEHKKNCCLGTLRRRLRSWLIMSVSAHL